MADTWELRVNRLRQERRKTKGFPRTVSSYRVFHNGVAVAGLTGLVVERQGPGDNTKTGTSQHRRIAAGRYPLETHSGANAPGTTTPKYRTIGYSESDRTGGYSRPCIGVADTGFREGILIHPAQDYCWSIGCLNPGNNLNGPNDAIDYKQSRLMVTALIDDMKNFLKGEFPTSNNRPITGASLVITGEPS
jgi:hypothetical protein